MYTQSPFSHIASTWVEVGRTNSCQARETCLDAEQSGHIYLDPLGLALQAAMMGVGMGPSRRHSLLVATPSVLADRC